MKAVEVAEAVEVEMAKRLMFELLEVALMASLAQGEVEESPRESWVSFQKKATLSWVRSPPEPMKGTDP